MDTPPKISTLPAVSVGGFRSLLHAESALAGVGSFPTGFVRDNPPYDAAASTQMPPKIKNFYDQLQTILVGTPLESSPEKLAILLALGNLHNFGSMPGMETNNWLLVPLAPPCDPATGRVPVPNYVPATCVQTYPTPQDGLKAFLLRLNEIGFLSFLVNINDGNFTRLAAAIYPLPEMSGVDPSAPLSAEGFKEFQVIFWAAYQNVLQSIAPADASRASNFWYLTEEIPPFGPPSSMQAMKSLPTDKVQRIYTAAYFLASEWPLGQLPLADTVQAQTAIQGVLAITYLFGDFGKLNHTETNNWFQLGSPRVNNEPCGEMRTLNTLLQRCVWIYETVQKGVQAALSTIVMSPNVKEQLLSGDLGKLAHAVIKDGFFAPTIPTKEIWVEAARILGVAVEEIVAISGDTPRWKITDFIPNDFIGMVPNPNPCKEDEELVAGQCEKKQTPNVIDTTNLSHEDTEKKSNLGWWLLGAGIALGAGGWWFMSKKDNTSPALMSSLHPWLEKIRDP